MKAGHRFQSLLGVCGLLCAMVFALAVLTGATGAKPSKATPAVHKTTQTTTTKAAKTPPPKEARKSKAAATKPTSTNAKTHRDLTTSGTSPAQRLEGLLDSARRQTDNVGRTASRYSDMLEEKERNIRNTAQAVYVLGLANDGPSYLGADITWPQYAVLKSTFRADAAELKPARQLEEPLRAALLQSKARLSDLETTIAGALHATTTTIHAISATSNTAETSATTLQAHVSTSTAELIAREYSRTFGERNLPAGMSEILASAEKLIRMQRSRATIASFAPPPPKPNPTNFISPDSPIPQEAGGKIQHAPPPPKLQTPTHNGMDIALKKNAEVRAIGSGSVVFSGAFRGYGNLIVIEHPASYFSVYGFLDTMKVALGDAVTTGQKVGTPGTLSPNNQGFHFELRRNELPAEPRELAGDRELMNLIAPGGRVSTQGHR